MRTEVGEDIFNRAPDTFPEVILQAADALDDRVDLLSPVPMTRAMKKSVMQS